VLRERERGLERDLRRAIEILEVGRQDAGVTARLDGTALLADAVTEKE
jgi:hypothetical protein